MINKRKILFLYLLPVECHPKMFTTGYVVLCFFLLFWYVQFRCCKLIQLFDLNC